MGIVSQVCEGLRLAHEGVTLWRDGVAASEHIKVVHRDLKPDNIFLVPTTLGELVKVLDFGIAKIRDDQPEQTNFTSVFLGTPHYAAPEQLRVAKDLDERADIYSLGIVLYEMLSGTDPFGLGLNVHKHNISGSSWAEAHTSRPPQPLREQPGCEQLPPELDAVVLRCLQKAPSERFASVDELNRALKAAVSPPRHDKTRLSDSQKGHEIKQPPDETILQKDKTPSDRERIPKPLLQFAASIFTLLIVLGGGYFLLKDRLVTCLTIPSRCLSPTYKTLAEVPNVPISEVEGTYVNKEGRKTFPYGGSTTLAPLRSKEVNEAIYKAHPQFLLGYREPSGGDKPGSGTGIKMLIAGELSFAQSSRLPNNTELTQAKARNFSLKPIPVAIDGIALYVHPKLPIYGLTQAQVKDIFTGEKTNWEEVGGPNLEITPFSRNLQASATVEFFEEKILEGTPFSKTVQEVRDTTESIRKVNATPGGIGYASAPEVVPQTDLIHPLSLSQSKPGFRLPL